MKLIKLSVIIIGITLIGACSNINTHTSPDTPTTDSPSIKSNLNKNKGRMRTRIA